jgi:Sec-independent protein translocase protein TatA
MLEGGDLLIVIGLIVLVLGLGNAVLAVTLRDQIGRIRQCRNQLGREQRENQILRQQVSTARHELRSRQNEDWRRAIEEKQGT